MSIGATISVVISNPRLQDVKTADKVRAVDFDHEMENHGLVSPATSDITTVVSTGVINRTMTANFTQTFMDSWPDDPTRIAALTGWVKGSLSQRIPFIEEFATETIRLF